MYQDCQYCGQDCDVECDCEDRDYGAPSTPSGDCNTCGADEGIDCDCE